MVIKKALLLSLLFLLQFSLCFAQNLGQQIEQIAEGIKGHVGVCALNLTTGEQVTYHGQERFPMQSVYKFPIAMAVLHEVDKGKLDLNQIIHISPSEYIPQNGRSPIRDQFPKGADLTVEEILKYNIEESDGSACDVLLRLLGGTKNADKYIRRFGIDGIAISTTEKLQVANDPVQYRNWSTPMAMTELFKIFYSGHVLSQNSTALLLRMLTESTPGAHRIKGLLPAGTIVAHKTGTANTVHGLTRATNDAGIITLPRGQHVILSAFVADAYATEKDRELTIASIAKAAYYYWSKPK